MPRLTLQRIARMAAMTSVLLTVTVGRLAAMAATKVPE